MKIKLEPTSEFPKNEALDKAIAVDGHDPYFLWVLENDGANVGNAGTRSQHTKSGQVVVTKYFQVLIELWDDAMQDGEKNQRIVDFREFAEDGTYHFRARSAHKFDEDRFICGIVNQEGLQAFLGKIDSVCVRYEMAHPIGPESLEPNYFAPVAAKAAARAQAAEWDSRDELLSGNVMVIIDYGCPFAHEAFRKGDKSRVRYVWFQGTAPITKYRTLPKACRVDTNNDLFAHGYELRGSTIDDLVKGHSASGVVDEAAIYEEIGYELMLESSTHGGHVMDIACGHPNPLYQSENDRWLSGQRIGSPSTAKESDAAGEAQIIFVQLPYAAVGDSSGGGMNVFLIDALKYVLLRTTEDANVVVNCSFGTNAGPHDGTSMLERAIDFYAARRKQEKFRVVIPAGNSFNSGCHATGEIFKDHPLELMLDVAADKPSDTFVEVWYTGDQNVEIEVAPPNGNYMTDKVALGNMASWRADVKDNPVCTIVHCANATPGRGAIAASHMALIAIAPTRPYDKSNPSVSSAEASYGHWKIRLSSKAAAGAKTTIDAWIERDDPIFQPPSNRQSRFVTNPQLDDQDEYASSPVTKFNTINSYSTGDVYTAGAMVAPNARTADLTHMGDQPFVSPYASAGPPGGSLRHGVAAVPSFIAYADDSEVLLGRNAAGSRTRSAVRRDGSSVAAPQVARALVNAGGSLPNGAKTDPSFTGSQIERLSAHGILLQGARVGEGQLIT